MGLGSASLDDCAMTVLATVVSNPAADRLILDCGSKTLSTDSARGFTVPSGYGAILTPDGTIDGALKSNGCRRNTPPCARPERTRLGPGERVRVLPNHSCLVANMVDEVVLVDGERVIDKLPVAARGRIT